MERKFMKKLHVKYAYTTLQILKGMLKRNLEIDY